ncbi:nucleotidyltransferase AbiEii toxin of type IV toxin-antitoxin system [Natranaerovirga hydrolytica]|uniref:Nucleotidyltransferase AbiEii toxin of type IV toxin-antitoxin system n=1 Tax=Natranaerovirga hydrolytica TaxID=680378 RepID=A0A4R1MKR7_9FIRM|nr:nucleotidyl transferase AbiEii/AbiGii toxin family protein [Natranaerovirga hydrolytica]TCK93157.1 nucleotidyltransferase AbiEii toxin of type IV toxin-antitoxin system [Natranaerovirga hydrolytica]
MKIDSPRQLKDWINNMAKKNNIIANTVLQNFMMERLLERISVSKYKDHFILKGGFLIAAMVGIDMRSTLDMDTTIKGIPVTRETIEEILSEILLIDLDDNVSFSIKNIKNIHDVSDYDDFRVSVEARFFTIKVNMKIDITTGDVIIPSEVEYSFKLMFEERNISIKAYNLDTVLEEKIESILTRNVANTRARDYYDAYILLTLRRNDIDLESLRNAIKKKAEERNTLGYVENIDKYLKDIEESEDLQKVWVSYTKKYPYAEGIQFGEITNILREIFKAQ